MVPVILNKRTPKKIINRLKEINGTSIKNSVLKPVVYIFPELIFNLWYVETATVIFKRIIPIRVKLL